MRSGHTIIGDYHLRAGYIKTRVLVGSNPKSQRYWVNPVRYRAMSLYLSLHPRLLADDIPASFVEREGICIPRRGRH
jgi:hypothetical protein